MSLTDWVVWWLKHPSRIRESLVRILVWSFYALLQFWVFSACIQRVIVSTLISRGIKLMSWSVQGLKTFTLMDTRRKGAYLIKWINEYTKLVYLYYKNAVGRVEM
jgi:hypothetical protein